MQSTKPKYSSIRNVPAGSLLGNNGGAVGPAVALSAVSARALLGLGTAALASTGDFAAMSHTHLASQISDSTAAGRALLTAADEAAQRTALGLGSAAIASTGDFAAAAHTHTFASLTSKPTTLAGYGITDAASPAGSDGQIQYKNGSALGGAAGLAWSASSPNVTITAQGASHNPLLIKGAATYTGNFLESQNNSNAVVSKLTAVGAMQFGLSSGNDYMSIGPGDSSIKNMSNVSTHSSRGIGCGSTWMLMASTTAVATVSSSSLLMSVPIDFGGTATIQCTQADSPITLQGFGGGTQARTGNGVELNGGNGGTGGNFRGGNIAIRTGKTAGNAPPATIDFQVSPAGSSGAGVQAWASALTIDGTKTFFIGNVTAAPGVNPTGGGYLYVESGALKFRGSSGTITTIAAA